MGQFRLEITGVPSHSGVDFSAGHSAIRELAWQIEQISALTDLARGTTLNVGVVGGGTQSNVVAASAWADIDLRVEDACRCGSDCARAESAEAARCRVHIAPDWRIFEPAADGAHRGYCGLIRPGERARGRFGLCAGGSSDGAGGSDGNFTSALGVPTLDGMGAIGVGAHAENESMRIDSLAPRTALLAGMIAMTA